MQERQTQDNLEWLWDIGQDKRIKDHMEYPLELLLGFNQGAYSVAIGGFAGYLSQGYLLLLVIVLGHQANNIKPLLLVINQVNLGRVLIL
ncbi:unnamed protein product [Sphagnum jensenii]|uniref:Uncharacterized protein n=1 Tax=Sphagnum jensenii TaxID=128206 RepID=A0ABP0VJ44_9BRYO